MQILIGIIGMCMAALLIYYIYILMEIMGIYFLWRLGMVIVILASFALFVFIYNKVTKHIHPMQKYDVQVQKRRDS